MSDTGYEVTSAHPKVDMTAPVKLRTLDIIAASRWIADLEQKLQQAVDAIAREAAEHHAFRSRAVAAARGVHSRLTEAMGHYDAGYNQGREDAAKVVAELLGGQQS